MNWDPDAALAAHAMEVLADPRATPEDRAAATASLLTPAEPSPDMLARLSDADLREYVRLTDLLLGEAPDDERPDPQARYLVAREELRAEWPAHPDLSPTCARCARYSDEELQELADALVEMPEPLIVDADVVEGVADAEEK